MGTSKSGSGIPGTSPLLPDWAPPADFPDEKEGEQPEEEKEGAEEANPVPERAKEHTANFSSVKGALTKYINNPSRSTFKSAARKYIRSTGGVKQATTSAAAGIKYGRGYINFLNNIQANGFQESLTQLGLGEHIGKSSE